VTDHSREILAVAFRVGQLQNAADSLQTFAHLSSFDLRRYRSMTAELIAERTLLEQLKDGVR
jgi:hypothetical protein